MNRILSKDQDDFDRCFPEAKRFLTAASLRYEAYMLLHLINKTDYTPWQEDRLNELLMIPACGVAWFKKMIENKL